MNSPSKNTTNKSIIVDLVIEISNIGGGEGGGSLIM
jgi:hypothetical protein